MDDNAYSDDLSSIYEIDDIHKFGGWTRERTALDADDEGAPPSVGGGV